MYFKIDLRICSRLLFINNFYFTLNFRFTTRFAAGFGKWPMHRGNIDFSARDPGFKWTRGKILGGFQYRIPLPSRDGEPTSFSKILLYLLSYRIGTYASEYNTKGEVYCFKGLFQTRECLRTSFHLRNTRVCTKI